METKDPNEYTPTRYQRKTIDAIFDKTGRTLGKLADGKITPAEAETIATEIGHELKHRGEMLKLTQFMHSELTKEIEKR